MVDPRRPGSARCATGEPLVSHHLSGTLTVSEEHRVSPFVACGCPELRSFVEWGLDMQLADVADLIRLPSADANLHAGQNFTAATVLLNLIAGASVWWFDASVDGLRARGDRSRRYREVLGIYWPWNGEGVDAQTGTEVLYNLARNPMSHMAGLPGPHDEPLLSLVKSPLTPLQIDELGASERRPEWLGPTIATAPGCPVGAAFQLSVPGLYWSMQRLLRGLLADPAQAQAANAVAATTIRRLTDPNAPWRQLPREIGGRDPEQGPTPD